MEIHERMEREVSLGEIFWKVLLGWRSIICAGLVFAILISGVKYLKDVRVYEASKNITGMPKTEIELTKEESEKVSAAKELKQRITEYENYMENSVAMQVNPYAEEVVELQYYVKSDFVINYTKDMQHDYTDDISAMYCNFIGSGAVSQKVTEELGMDISQEDFSELLELEQEEASASIYVTIGGMAKEELEQVSDILDSLLKEKEKELQQIGSHQLVLVDKNINVIVNQDLADKRNAVLNNISALEKQLNSLKTAMTPNQLAVLNEEEETEKSESINTQTAIVKPVFSIKYAILGVVVGMFCVCVWIVMKMLFAARLQNVDEIRKLYGVRLFGEIAVSQSKKRFLSGIDNLILRLKNRGRKKMSLEQQLKMAVANIVLSCKQHNTSCIYITGSEYENMDSAVVNALKKELQEQGIKIAEGENIFYDADSLKQAAENRYILLMEQTNISVYNEIDNELRVAAEQKINVLGAIVLV